LFCRDPTSGCPAARFGSCRSIRFPQVNQIKAVRQRRDHELLIGTPAAISSANANGRVVTTTNLIVDGVSAIAELPRGQFGVIQQTRAGEQAMKNLVVRFVREEEGQDLIEYSLLAAIIAVGSIAVMGNVKTAINTVFTKIVTALNAA